MELAALDKDSDPDARQKWAGNLLLVVTLERRDQLASRFSA